MVHALEGIRPSQREIGLREERGLVEIAVNFNPVHVRITGENQEGAIILKKRHLKTLAVVVGLTKEKINRFQIPWIGAPEIDPYTNAEDFHSTRTSLWDLHRSGLIISLGTPGYILDAAPSVFEPMLKGPWDTYDIPLENPDLWLARDYPDSLLLKPFHLALITLLLKNIPPGTPAGRIALKAYGAGGKTYGQLNDLVGKGLLRRRRKFYTYNQKQMERLRHIHKIQDRPVSIELVDQSPETDRRKPLPDAGSFPYPTGNV